MECEAIFLGEPLLSKKKKIYEHKEKCTQNTVLSIEISTILI